MFFCRPHLFCTLLEVRHTYSAPFGDSWRESSAPTLPLKAGRPRGCPRVSMILRSCCSSLLFSKQPDPACASVFLFMLFYLPGVSHVTTHFFPQPLFPFLTSFFSLKTFCLSILLQKLSFNPSRYSWTSPVFIVLYIEPCTAVIIDSLTTTTRLGLLFLSSLPLWLKKCAPHITKYCYVMVIRWVLRGCCLFDNHTSFKVCFFF